MIRWFDTLTTNGQYFPLVILSEAKNLIHKPSTLGEGLRVRAKGKRELYTTYMGLI